MVRLLRSADTPGQPYTHQQIADWARRLFQAAIEHDDRGLPTPVDPETLAVAKDVDAQWELFLANTYTLAGLQGLDFSTVELPFDWFETWLLELGG